MVDWVQDGDKALSTLRLEEYTLVLLDIGLPKISSLDLLQAMSKNKKMLP